MKSNAMYVQLKVFLFKVPYCQYPEFIKKNRNNFYDKLVSNTRKFLKRVNTLNFNA